MPLLRRKDLPLAPAAPPDVLRFLHEAYPTWDIADTRAHALLQDRFPSPAIAKRIADALQAGDIVGSGYGEPQGDCLCHWIYMWPRVPADFLPGGPKGPGPRQPPPPDAPPRVPWALLRISVLGPFAALTWFSNPGLPREESRGVLVYALAELLRANSLELLPREALWAPLIGMRERGRQPRGLAPNVERALFGEGNVISRS